MVKTAVYTKLMNSLWWIILKRYTESSSQYLSDTQVQTLERGKDTRSEVFIKIDVLRIYEIPTKINVLELTFSNVSRITCDYEI